MTIFKKEGWRRLTERDITMHQLPDGDRVISTEVPEGMVEDMPVVATAIQRRKTPLHSWRINMDSIKMAGTQSSEQD